MMCASHVVQCIHRLTTGIDARVLFKRWGRGVMMRRGVTLPYPYPRDCHMTPPPPITLYSTLTISSPTTVVTFASATPPVPFLFSTPRGYIKIPFKPIANVRENV